MRRPAAAFCLALVLSTGLAACGGGDSDVVDIDTEPVDSENTAPPPALSPPPAPGDQPTSDPLPEPGPSGSGA